MIDTSARLLRLLSLLQSRPFWRGPELAARMDVTERTVRRDVDRLRSLGYPVASSAGTAGGYQLAAGSNLPPLLLEDDEALAVSLGLRMATGGTVVGMEESALRALAKLEQVMPARLRTRVRNLHAAVLPLGPGGPEVPHARLVALANACRALQRVDFDYEDQEGRGSARRVEPHALVSTEARWYLLAWDLVRGDWRTFRVDRIAGMPRGNGERFLPRKVPGGDAAAFVSRAISVQPYAVKARIELHAPLARMRERIPASAGKLTRLDAQRCELETGAQRPDMLAYHLALLDVSFVVIEPVELEQHLRALSLRLSRAARASSRRRRGAAR
ncbi:helix-turn-helix transcriptional regulator [Luteimonas kalidii]|uniref:WYL domain-containing protein n=1 Tax=Luteimonas kalidii TaxID=3042025 RepID=A0ABT6JW00_9GAMM|nr:WYL domain-containing protein [Luteimonas kalidii]MDH5834873.1 WYL domain-containing protein [Luteimonas kalidii]